MVPAGLHERAEAVAPMSPGFVWRVGTPSPNWSEGIDPDREVHPDLHGGGCRIATPLKLHEVNDIIAEALKQSARSGEAFDLQCRTERRDKVPEERGVSHGRVPNVWRQWRVQGVQCSPGSGGAGLAVGGSKGQEQGQIRIPGVAPLQEPSCSDQRSENAQKDGCKKDSDEYSIAEGAPSGSWATCIAELVEVAVAGANLGSATERAGFVLAFREDV